VPPLRERKEDIPLLAAHFVSTLNKEYGTNFAGFTPEAMDALISYHWPGNIREFKNVISGVMTLESQKFIGLETLKQFIPIIFTEKENEPFLEGGDYSQALSNFESEYFLKLLGKHRWNVEEAAKEAGINIATLYRKIKRYNLKKE
jgi:transcriptional regulator with PAS, ATPase and Fis domain